MSDFVGFLQGMSFLQGGKEGSASSKKIGWESNGQHQKKKKKAKYELMKSVRQSEGGSVSFVFIPFAFL